MVDEGLIKYYYNYQINDTALMKSSNFSEHFRELMVGENQCGKKSEWTSELQTEPFNFILKLNLRT